jgi:hypothetical protein
MFLTAVFASRVAETPTHRSIATVMPHPLNLERFDWMSWFEGSIGIDELAAMPRAGKQLGWMNWRARLA